MTQRQGGTFLLYEGLLEVRVYCRTRGILVSIGGGGTIAEIEKVRGKKRIEKQTMGR
jgi:hypothetical protein